MYKSVTPGPLVFVSSVELWVTLDMCLNGGLRVLDTREI